MDDVAELATDDRVVAVVTCDGVAEVATLLVAVEVLTAEEPAARPLVDVAADRAEVADERRRDREGRVAEQAELARDGLVVDDIAERGGGADGQAAVVLVDADELLDGGDVDEDLRERQALSVDPVLHEAADEVAATSDHARVLRRVRPQEVDGFFDRVRVVELECSHLISLLLASLQRGKKLVACEWHVEDPCPDGVVDRIDDGRRGRTHRGLAQAVRAERAVGLGLLDDADLGERRVLDGQRTVVEQGLIALPTSWTATYRVIFTVPVTVSTSTSAACAPTATCSQLVGCR